MVTFDLIFVFIVIIFILVALYFELLGASFVFMIAIVALGIFGILTPSEILSGFANEQIAVIILLLLLGEIIRKTTIIEGIFDRIFLSVKTYRGFMARMSIIISGFSAFLNNTPLVAIMMPYVNSWCKKNDVSPSKLLIPLSYAAILGGCMTLIGTSTNLIVNGLVVDQKIIPGLKSLDIFDFIYVGLPMAIIGVIYMYYIGDKLLPEKSPAISDFTANTRKYLVEAQIRPNSKLIGKTIEEAGLRNLKGLFLVEVIRKSYKITAVSPNVVLNEEDILIFAGETGTIADLIKSDIGLTLPSVGMLVRKKKTEVVEVVISHKSVLINKTVKDFNFRAKYDATLIAVHRNGERITGKIGEIILKAGDVLLLYTGDQFMNLSQNSQDFYFISSIKKIEKLETYKIVTLLGGTVLAILLASFKIMSLFMGLLILILISLAFKITSPKEIPKNIDYDLALIIAMSLALGTAMIKTGAAELIADLLINIFVPLGPVGILFGIYLITAILAAYITNKASVAIIFPISLTIAVTLNLNPLPFIFIVSFAAAANFMTPIGYQTNLMVYGPGGYSFKDFFKIGFPLTIIYMVVTVTILSLIYF
ncbi:MAG: SLC13 family permease [Bacteroidales bacterium]|nr:SLC13 family permease [Bacteroidales bacterium]